MAKMNRVQVQPGMSLTEFMDLYGTESQCEAAVEKAAGPTGLSALNARERGIVWCGMTR